MKKIYGDLVASDMLLNLASDENLALFHREYKPSKDSSDEHYEHQHSDESCEHEDSSEEESEHDSKHEEDEEDYDNVYYALDTAVANLINASAALDAVGFEKSASLSLKIANFVAVAKKKTKDKKNKKKNLKDSGKSSKKVDLKDSKKTDKKDSKNPEKKDSGKNSKKMDSKDSGKSSKKKVAQMEGSHEIKSPFEHQNIANEVQLFVNEVVKSLNLKPVYKVVYADVSPDTGVLSLKIGYPESSLKESSVVFNKLKQALIGKTFNNTPVKSVNITGMFGNY